MIRIGGSTGRKTFGSLRVTLNVEVGIIDRVILVSPGSYLSEWPRIDQFPAPVGSLENFAVSLASVDAAGTQSA
jgi:hypothetical protein